jgi:transposase-like protein
VWLYYRCCLSYRDGEALLFVRGVIVSYEAVRKWCRKVGQQDATQLRRRRLRPGDTWHLDEVFLTINKERHYLWRAVDQDGHVLEILVQRRRDKKAAKKFFRKLLKGLTYVPRVLIIGVTAMQPDMPFAFDITLTKPLAVDASSMQILTAELNRHTELLTRVCEDLSAPPPA